MDPIRSNRVSFDDVARGAAQATSRRQALRLIGAGAICGPACALHGGESATGCVPDDPACV
jgi:hypothetical protein